MKNLFKNIFSKASLFGKKYYKNVTSFIKRNPKISLVLFLFIVSIPSISYGTNVVLSGLESILSLFKYLAGIIMRAAGLLFDNMIYVTISKKFYDLTWVKIAWGTMRDLANIAFIGGVIVIGFFLMIGREYKKMLLNLIIVAFIMNFSMFVGRVIIDAGNFTSAIFYSMVSVNVKDDSLVHIFFTCFQVVRLWKNL